MLGWHFLADGPEGPILRDKTLAPPAGQWLRHTGPIIPCESGLHVSEHPFDALQYAPGPILCRVRLEGSLRAHGNPVDKWVGARRLILWQVDATEVLHAFARVQALSVTHLWDCPNVVRQYLETGDESLWKQAWVTIRSAAPVCNLAQTATCAAVQAVSWIAARSAARSAVWSTTLGTVVDLATIKEQQRNDFLVICENLRAQ